MLISISGNPVPDGAVAGKVRTPDGFELRFARWDAPAGGKGTVCVFGGRGEFIEKYFETVGELRQRGFAVAVMDWRGQGHSARQLPDPRKGHVEDFAEYEIDVETFMQQVVLPNCPQPHFALTHSMGGAVVLRAAHSGKPIPPAIRFPSRLDRTAAAHSGVGGTPCRPRQVLRTGR
jgi:lysophospholipase